MTNFNGEMFGKFFFGKNGEQFFFSKVCLFALKYYLNYQV